MGLHKSSLHIWIQSSPSLRGLATYWLQRMGTTPLISPRSIAANGQHLRRLLALHVRRRSLAAPRRRGSAREEPRQHVLPARPGAVLVGDTRALPRPMPARAPLLARLGSWLVRRRFQALLSTVGLQLPEFLVFLSLLVTWPAWCLLSRLHLSLLAVHCAIVTGCASTRPRRRHSMSCSD